MINYSKPRSLLLHSRAGDQRQISAAAIFTLYTASITLCSAVEITHSSIKQNHKCKRRVDRITRMDHYIEVKTYIFNIHIPYFRKEVNLESRNGFSEPSWFQDWRRRYSLILRVQQGPEGEARRPGRGDHRPRQGDLCD